MYNESLCKICNWIIFEKTSIYSKKNSRDPKELERLAYDNSDVVKEAVLKNVNTPENVVQQICSDNFDSRIDSLRLAIAKKQMILKFLRSWRGMSIGEFDKLLLNIQMALKFLQSWQEMSIGWFDKLSLSEQMIFKFLKSKKNCVKTLIKWMENSL